MRGGIGSPKAEKLALCSAEKGCSGIQDRGKGRAWQHMQRAVLAWKFCPFQHARRRCGEAAQPCSGARIVMVAHRGSTCPRACFYKVERALREQLGPQGPAARCAHVTCCLWEDAPGLGTLRACGMLCVGKCMHACMVSSLSRSHVGVVGCIGFLQASSALARAHDDFTGFSVGGLTMIHSSV